MFENIKAVIFDLDGTLVDSMWVWRDVDIKFLNKRGIELPEDLQREIEGMSFNETASYFKKRFSLSESIEEIMNEWDELTFYFFKEKVLLKEGVIELLELLKKSGIKIAIGTSNTKDRTIDLLKKYDILDYFNSIRTSCEVGKGKPFPDIFLKVSEDLEIDPKNCLVFEDTYAGVLAAKRAGMKVYAIADESSLKYKKEISELADNYIENFIEIA